MQGTRHLGWMLLAVGLLAVGLLAAGSCRQLDPGTGEIRFRVEAGWQSGTKAAMYDDGTVSEGSFVVSAYNGGTANSYFLDCTVSYAAGAWSFDGGQRYWPASGTLDFHAWMPATRPSYITSPTYAAGNPGFTCSGLPLTAAGQATIHEYVYAVESNRGKDGGDVSLAFQRPFAKVRFQMDGCPGVTIHSITIENVYNNGVYTHASGWTSTGSAGNLVLQLNDTHYDEGTGVVAVGDPMLVKPQTLGTQQIVVDYTLDGGAPRTQKTFSVSIASWAAGHGYTYTLSMPDWLSVGVSGEPISWTSELLGAGAVINWTSELLGAGSVINWASNIGSGGDDLHWGFTETASGEDFSWGPPEGFGGPFLADESNSVEYFLSKGDLYLKSEGSDFAHATFALYDDPFSGYDTNGGKAPRPSASYNAANRSYFSIGEFGPLFSTEGDGMTPKGIPAGYKIPTLDQWKSIAGRTRPGSTVNGGAGKYHYSLVNVDGKTALVLILFPDGANITLSGTLPAMDAVSSVKTISEADYQTLDAAGCVFLPAAGYDDGGSWARLGTRGRYWASNGYNSLSFYDSSLSFPSSGVRFAPIRLIREF